MWASFGTWGDSSLVHACVSNRGIPTIVSAGATCQANETQAIWIKDVDAGTGLTATRSSDGITLSLANSNDGWTASGETWTYATADDPTFTFTISGDKTNKYSKGMRIKLTQTTTKYFIITGISYSSPNTNVTVYGGTDYDLANASITDPNYSTHKAPHGFPLDPTKWTEQYTSSSNLTQNNPSSGTWYNLGSNNIDIPTGSWSVEYEVVSQVWDSTSKPLTLFVTLSTGNNSESDSHLTSRQYLQNGTNIIHNQYRRKDITVSSETTYYLNAKVDQSGIYGIEFTGNSGPTIIRAVSAYL